jgi:GTP pyrophosphokinase
MTNPKNVNIEKDVKQIISEVNKYLPEFDEKKFLKAYDFAKKAHKGQFRKDKKTPYIAHPLKTVKILTKLHVDENTLIAALVHDVPEDTEKTLRDVEKLFGKKVAFLVNGITKLSKVYYRHDMAERQIESLKKLLIHSAKDPRVILIKLADRLHNMNTLEYVRPEKRLRIAKETLEIYVPIANLLGIEQMRKKLEDLCFKYVFPKEYEKINNKLAETKLQQANLLEGTIKEVKSELENEGLSNVKIEGREKSPYSIYKKTLRKEKSPDELEDLLALRIIVNSVKDCYTTLGIIHSIYRPKPKRFKDYIAVPKSNGYRSLHTIVFGLKGQITEFQIRTEEMHLDALYGIAAHYFYRTKQNKEEMYAKKHSQWAKKILEYQKANYDSEHFLEALKIDIFQDRIFTFTPKGDTIDLPRGATAIDFAYAIHTEVGNNALKAEINGVISPLTTTLKTGDVVSIITSPQQKGPSREWLIFAKTNLAKNKIREALRAISRKKKYSIGRKLLQKEFDRAGIGLIEEIPKKKIKELTAKYEAAHNCNTYQDVVIAVGEGTINPVDVVKILYPRHGFMPMDTHGFLKKLFGSPKPGKKRVELKIRAVDRIGAGRDILGILSEQNINIIKLKVSPRRFHDIFAMHVILEVDSFDQLSYICEKMDQIDEIIEVQRQFHTRKIPFYTLAALTIALWVIHPLSVYYFSHETLVETPINFILYGGIVMLFLLVYQLKKITKKSFPEIRETGKTLWLLTFLIGNFALLTIIGEIYFLELYFNWFLVFGLILFIYAYLASEYIEYKQESESE